MTAAVTSTPAGRSPTVLAMAQAGADIIDIGGESSRPGAAPVSEADELARVIPVIQGLRRQCALPISIDSYKEPVARAALDAGADIVNDISALGFDPAMAPLVANEKVPVVLMHMRGTPRTMQADPQYADVVREVRDFLAERLYDAMDAGIDAESIVLDPGIGFGKTVEHNLQLLRGLSILGALGQPLLVGRLAQKFHRQDSRIGPGPTARRQFSRSGGGGAGRCEYYPCPRCGGNLPRGAGGRRAALWLSRVTEAGMLELLHQIRWQDALDIGIITFLVYRALQIVRGSRAMQMIIGLAVILVAYVSSRILGLFTLNWILDNFLSSIILVIIVIFQSDIRRALTQVGTAPLFSTLERSEQRREDVVEEVAQAAMSLASKRVGALVVFQRDVGLSEFMEIGTRLDAWVSRELLESVFLPHSPIHDGALVIQKGRVTAVRCLLPLSTNPHLRKSLGHAPSRRPWRHRGNRCGGGGGVGARRHGGAGGRRQCDGKYRRRQTALGVAGFDQVMKQLWERIVALAGSNFGLKALALTIAVGLWLAGHRDIERSIEVPVEFRNIPSDLMVMDNRVDFVVLRVTGPRTLVSTIDADELKLLFDLNSAKPGTVSYPLGGSSFNIPRGVTRGADYPAGDPSAHGAGDQVDPAGLGAHFRQAGGGFPHLSNH